MFLTRENVAILKSSFNHVHVHILPQPVHNKPVSVKSYTFQDLLFQQMSVWLFALVSEGTALCFSLSNYIPTFSNLHRYLLQKTKQSQLSMCTVQELIWTMQKGSK
jgi:hypothetical protein